MIFTAWVSIIPLSYLAMEGIFIFGTRHIREDLLESLYKDAE